MINVTQPKTQTLEAGPRRGEKLATGGHFVGRAATTWVSYGDDSDFRQMCRDFDRIWNSTQSRLRPSA